ncbi:hypothetical protein ABPD29_03200 [Secundilactobacillus paracollinoides]|uniref:hypothetical protein n=1 Tax=Secundilactobacillus paracollinoides TaxID=240427 RepID=UPI003F48A5C9
MKTKKTILTNIVDYTFDKIAFDMDFRLIRVQLQDNSEQSQFQQIVQRIDVIAMTNLSSSMCYLLMVRRGTSVTELEKSNLVFEIIRLGNLPDNVYENQVFQLLLNQESALENLQPEKNKSPHLLISLNDWVNKPKRTNDWKQRYALRVGLNWESDLDLKVQTYTHFPKSKETDELFYWNSERRNLQKSFMHKESVLFRYKNGTGRNSTVAFLNLEQIEKFEVSEVGVAWILLTNVSKHFGKYFEQLPKYLGSEVLQFDKQKLDNKAAIWRQFKGEIINIYYDSNEPLTKVLALEISHALQDSGILNDYGIQIKLSDKSSSGFNIQIIRDARDTGNISDTYEVGDSQRYIQHATIENFGGFDKRTNALNWQLDQTGKVDAANDDTLVKLAQELIIKRDLANRDASIIYLPLVKKHVIINFTELSGYSNPH